jgi:amphiphysin
MTKLTIFKQAIKEKLAKTKDTEDEEYLNLRAQIDRTEKYVSKACRITRSFCQKCESTSKLQNEMGEFFAESGLQETAEFSECMIKIGEAIKSLSTIQHAMLINIVEKYIQPSMQYNKEFDAGSKLHTKYNNKRLEYNAQNNVVDSMNQKKEASKDPNYPQKIQEAEDKLKKLEEEREELFAETYESSVEELVKRDTKHLSDMCDLLFSFHHFFAEGYTLTHDLQPYLEKLKEKSKDRAANMKKNGVPTPKSPLQPSAPTASKPTLDQPKKVEPVKQETKKVETKVEPKSSGGGDKPVAEAKALYDYEAQEDTEISFSAGDTIQVFSMEGDWWLGCTTTNKKKGHFPNNFVQIGSGKTASKPAAKPSGGARVTKALYAFDGNEAEGEMSFTEGDALVIEEELDGGWWKGINMRTGKKGLFPSNYTEDGQ